jgi:hypothetical protein
VVTVEEKDIGKPASMLCTARDECQYQQTRIMAGPMRVMGVMEVVQVELQEMKADNKVAIIPSNIMAPREVEAIEHQITMAVT